MVIRNTAVRDQQIRTKHGKARDKKSRQQQEDGGCDCDYSPNFGGGAGDISIHAQIGASVNEHEVEISSEEGHNNVEALVSNKEAHCRYAKPHAK